MGKVIAGAVFYTLAAVLTFHTMQRFYMACRPGEFGPIRATVGSVIVGALWPMPMVIGGLVVVFARTNILDCPFLNSVETP